MEKKHKIKLTNSENEKYFFHHGLKRCLVRYDTNFRRSLVIAYSFAWRI